MQSNMAVGQIPGSPGEYPNNDQNNLCWDVDLLIFGRLVMTHSHTFQEWSQSVWAASITAEAQVGHCFVPVSFIHCKKPEHRRAAERRDVFFPPADQSPLMKPRKRSHFLLHPGYKDGQ